MLPQQDHVEPGKEAAGAIEAMQIFPRSDHGLLHKVLRLMSVGTKRKGLCHQPGLLAFHES